MPYIESMGSFRRWVLREGADIFGFDKRSKTTNLPRSQNQNPVNEMKSDLMVEFMLSRPIDGVSPVADFSNQIRWGEGTGSVRMVVSPLGSCKGTIRRLQPDLEGREVWACKRVMPFKKVLEDGVHVDDKLGWVLLEEVEKVRRGIVEAPSHDWGGFHRLVSKAARKFQRHDIMPEIFMYKGVREAKKDSNYLIVFEVRGHGVEAPGRARVEEFIVDMSYNPSTGMVRCFGHDVQSPTRGHVWYPAPSEWDEYFSSGQGEDEILDCIGGALGAY